MRNFRQLNIWKEGIEIVKEIYMITKEMPEREKFGLIAQLRRAAVSIPSNIAEGCSRNSNIEYKRFLEIAMGSSFELETQLYIVQELQLLKHEALNPVFELLNTEQKMINNLITKIKKTKD